MQGFDCSCNGENPNCFKCFGSGIAEGRASQVGRPHLQPGKKTYSKKQKISGDAGAQNSSGRRTYIKLKKKSTKVKSEIEELESPENANVERNEISN